MHTHDTTGAGENAPLSHRRAMLAGIGGLAAGAMLSRGAVAGPLNPPPGPVSSTPGPEPRTVINQTNTPGNGSNTFVISEPGSYYLDRNLVGESGKNGIWIAANDVSIDLMGFTLQGVSGSLDGITSPTTIRNPSVRNGHIRGWGVDGISMLSIFIAGGVYENLQCDFNGGAGMRVPSGSVVTRCTASNNTSVGFNVAYGSSVAHCAAYENGSTGLHIAAASTVIGCTAASNDGAGFSVSGEGMRVADCASYGNGSNGYFGGSGGLIERCVARDNTLNGFSASFGTVIRDCIATFCDGSGVLLTSSDNRLEGNHFEANTIGVQVFTSGNFIVRNTCADNDTNWSVVAGNVCFVVSAVTSAAVNGNSGGSSPGTTSPWANFTF